MVTRLQQWIGLSSAMFVLVAPVSWAEGSEIKELQRPAKTLKEWRAQIEATTVQVTGVTLDRTDAGLDIVLETAEGKPLQVDASKFRREGNNLIADIPNATLALPEGQTFAAENPTADVATVQVVQQDASSIRISVTGNNALPKTEVTLKTGTLAYSLNPEADEPDEEIVVTGEQNRYRIPNTSTATKTDTPLRDIPQSIQIVPQQVLEDQNVTRLEEAIRNVTGVVNTFPPNFANGSFLAIRGFGIRDDQGNVLRNGLADFIGARQIDFSHIQQVEVLKGPASVLFGQGTPGGVVNLITKQPLRDPFYEINATIGNYDYYRGTVDLTGPLNDSKTVLYRLNAAYQNTGSFIDFIESERVFVAPVLSFAIGDRTKLTLEGEYSSSKGGVDLGLPAVGTVLPNPNGRIPLNRTTSEPFAKPFDAELYRIGYTLEHQFSDNWSLRNAFRVSSRDATQDEFLITSLEADNRTVNRRYRFREFNVTSYNFAVDLIGKFSTGSIKHQVVFGVDLGRFEESGTGTTRSIAPLDLFNPVYGQPLGDVTSRVGEGVVGDSLGIYIQDQVTLAENLKLLLGGRFDLYRSTSEDLLAETTTSESGDAFSPRVGIVYQPIPPISLYASYSRSFTPSFGTAADGSTFKPERGTQYEVGVKADLSNRLSATLAFYNLTRSNVLTTDPNDPSFSIQTGEQRSRGIELNLAGEILPGWNIFAGYSYIDARITKDNDLPIGNRLLNAPENSFNLWTTYEIQQGPLQGFGAGVGFFFVGERPGDLNNSFQLPSYFRTDASLFYRQGQFRAALNIRNLFNVDYFETSYSDTFVFPGEPFIVQGTISWQF
ncbi:TonB-dependent siderophore receptor [Myxacorys almedinensis]|uniref:TonB-dependent siderophore receptor n=1 Tax=Myxacorys almedinensis A TaxID=2690445 RepID=A0A8J8CKS4_9CYAN|nr:TonB-dependent siderophore receptor [Myxacorys almedinensis]NDJ19834.1 TonB-dependent siderophore receptor [Myxacorys almedinensis A]